MQPGNMTIYKLTGTRNDSFRIVFSYGQDYSNPAYREKRVGSWDVDDVNYWRSYVNDNFESLGNGYYEISRFYKFMNTINRSTIKPSLFQRFHEMPGLFKFLLIGTIVITGISVYQSLTPTTQNTEQH